MMTVVPPARISATPFVNTSPAGDPVWFLGARTWERANAAQTGGALGIIEHVLEPGFASPYHVHHNEDEEFFVIEGQIRFFVEGQTWVAGAGGFAFLPREIAHGFRVEGDAPARILLLTTPGGFEGFVTGLSEPAPPSGPPDLERLVQVAATYAIDILGPLPE
jgi:quercetin dioxygenase-like cupin family protein